MTERDEDGIKPSHFKGDIDRIHAYREWRRTLGSGLWWLDIDSVEWRMVNDELKPVATTELTVREPWPDPMPDSYLAAILDRYENSDLQGYHARYMAKALGVSCYIVLMEHDLSLFHVYNLSTSNGWWTMEQDVHSGWLDMPSDPTDDYEWDF